MANSKWQSQKVGKNGEEGVQDCKCRAQELETGNVSFSKKLQSNPSHNNNSAPSDSDVWLSNKDQVAEVQRRPTTTNTGGNDGKAKMKKSADTETYVRPFKIQLNGIVLVKRDDSKGKRDTPYQPEP